MNPEIDNINFLFREGLVIKPKQSIVEKVHESWKHTLVGKLHVDAYTAKIDHWLITEVISSAWVQKLTTVNTRTNPITVTTSTVIIRDLGHNILSFTFENEKDKLEIMEERPWKFFGHLLVLVDEWRPNITNPEVHYSLTKSPFWIEAHNLPPELICKDIGMEVGKAAGEVLEIDFNKAWDELREKYVRIRVNVDITKRLALGCWLYICEGNILWVPFRYEGLPKICYKCGVLGHIEKDCKVNVKPLIENYVVYGNGKKPGEGEMVRDMNKRGYGPWLYEEDIEIKRQCYVDFEDEDEDEDFEGDDQEAPDYRERVKLELNVEGEGTEPLLVRVEEEEEEELSRTSSY